MKGPSRDLGEDPGSHAEVVTELVVASVMPGATASEVSDEAQPPQSYPLFAEITSPETMVYA